MCLQIPLEDKYCFKSSGGQTWYGDYQENKMYNLNESNNKKVYCRYQESPLHVLYLVVYFDGGAEQANNQYYLFLNHLVGRTSANVDILL